MTAKNTPSELRNFVGRGKGVAGKYPLNIEGKTVTRNRACRIKRAAMGAMTMRIEAWRGMTSERKK
jgi:hypothetical protein